MKHIFIAALLVFAVMANLRAANPSYGEDLIIFTKFVNNANSKISNANLKMYLYDNEDLILSRNFNILKNSETKFITLYGTSSLEPGEYIIRATANHKDIGQKTRHAVFVYG